MSFYNFEHGYVTFFFNASEPIMMGTSYAKIRIKSLSPIDISPERFIFIEFDIKPCYVDSFSLTQQLAVPFESIVLNIGETITVPFKNYTQTPVCQYEVIYEVKMI